MKDSKIYSFQNQWEEDTIHTEENTATYTQKTGKSEKWGINCEHKSQKRDK